MAHSPLLQGWLEDYPDMVEMIIAETHFAAFDLFGTPEGTETTVTITVQSQGTHGFKLRTEKAPFNNKAGN